MKVATYQMASCSGCHVALVNLGLDLIEPLSKGELVFSPVLVDSKDVSEADVAFIEGGVRNRENLEMLKKLRDKTETLVAFGTCACFGGVPGIGSAFKAADLLSEAYGDDFLPEGIPILEQRVDPVDAHVKVDYYFPGCPPPPKLLKSNIQRLLEGQQPSFYDLPVCAECQRVAKKEVTHDLKRIAENFPEPDECLLSQGFVCLGSVSRGGCEAPCTHAGVPCLGCRGPIDRVFVEPTHGILYDLSRRISHFTGKTEKEVRDKLRDIVHVFYSFTLSVPELRKKDAEDVYKLINRIKV
ncbi:F420-nonreducing hydrogenase [bacterium]|nr:F420-nonreducing hydrogenase [bacterium]